MKWTHKIGNFQCLEQGFLPELVCRSAMAQRLSETEREKAVCHVRITELEKEKNKLELLLVNAAEDFAGRGMRVSELEMDKERLSQQVCFCLLCLSLFVVEEGSFSISKRDLQLVADRLPS